MVYKSDSTKGNEVFVDADFAGVWDPDDALNADNVYSYTGYVICYAGCPVFWQSKLQMDMGLTKHILCGIVLFKWDVILCIII